MSKSDAQILLEQTLMQQGYNGRYSNSQFDCMCANNDATPKLVTFDPQISTFQQGSTATTVPTTTETTAQNSSTNIVQSSYAPVQPKNSQTKSEAVVTSITTNNVTTPPSTTQNTQEVVNAVQETTPTIPSNVIQTGTIDQGGGLVQNQGTFNSSGNPNEQVQGTPNGYGGVSPFTQGLPSNPLDSLLANAQTSQQTTTNTKAPQNKSQATSPTETGNAATKTNVNGGMVLLAIAALWGIRKLMKKK